jgi:hypothetical protein
MRLAYTVHGEVEASDYSIRFDEVEAGLATA